VTCVLASTPSGPRYRRGLSLRLLSATASAPPPLLNSNPTLHMHV
jgi:hypothetical protein